MRSGETGLEMTAEELTLSCYRVWCNVTGVEREMEDLDADVQSRWLKAVRGAYLWLPAMDGQPASAGARKLMEEWCENDPALMRAQEPYLGEWEAVVRHLNAVLDGADELQDESDVRALEASWAAWLGRRPRKTPEA